MTTVKNIYDYINSIAPFDTQEEWDNAGFLVGDFRKEVKRAVICLDAVKDICAYSAEVNADLIISHHPIIFKGVKQLTKGSALYTCAQNNIAVISAHTNFDKSKYGINNNLCTVLGLKDAEPIENSFIYKGSLDCEMSIDDFAEFVSERLSVSGIRYTLSDKPIKTVALGGGACEEYIPLAMENADCFLTGDLKYHDMLEAAESGYPVISAGHFETEAEPFYMLKEMLQKMFPEVEFIIPKQENPVLTVI